MYVSMSPCRSPHNFVASPRARSLTVSHYGLHLHELDCTCKNIGDPANFGEL